ncbi:pleckstrin-like domain-containing family J member 1-like [Scleropages formosus]|uniref:Pleckstrin-like domain-containing family J member 1-like n=1 Tax=Scleropages formosus TaxID=113540 RepID=A0A0P7WP70_SCLFO|nr:pleckstrin-like domain-containing family J member 1-like [Scleropages formosus]
MRFNERELVSLSRQPSERAAELGMRGPRKGDAFLDEAERKYLFECDSKEQCVEWIESIVKASYEFMRKSLIFYRSEIQRMTGKDPLEQYGISDEARFQISSISSIQGT